MTAPRRTACESRCWTACLGSAIAAVGAVIFAPAYWAGWTAQAHQDRDLARVAVNFTRAGDYSAPLRIDAAALRYEPAGRCVAVAKGTADDPAIWSALSGGSAIYMVTDAVGSEVVSRPLRYPDAHFHGRGFSCGFLPTDLPAGDYLLTVRVVNPVAESGTADVFVWDRLYEFAFLGPLLWCFAGLPFLLAGAALLSAAAAWPWIVRLARWATHRTGRGADAHVVAWRCR